MGYMFNNLGFNIPVIEGGFGENQKVILAKTIAEIHGVELSELNRMINRNIGRFNENDLIGSNRTQNIFVLSERGYTKLVSMMDNTNEIKWQVMDKLIDEYFAMRAIIKSDEQFTNFKSTKNYQFKRSGGNVRKRT